jgi:hypothetical protein
MARPAANARGLYVISTVWRPAGTSTARKATFARSTGVLLPSMAALHPGS